MCDINYTKIIFDQNLIDCINLLHEENPKNFIDFIKLNKYKSLIVGQSIIREWIIKNQNLLNFNNKNTLINKSCNSFPDMYAFLMANICDLNICKSWQDVTDYIKKENLHNKTNIYCNFSEGSDKFGDEEMKCCCGHIVVADHTFILKSDSFFVLLGCDCIEKKEIFTKGEMKIINKNKPDSYLAIEQKRNKENAKKLAEVKKRKADEKALEELRKADEEALEELKKTHRLCSTCNRYTIVKPSFFNECTSCYYSYSTCMLKLK